ncbi:hypothetical protein BDN70DRAFT_209706 [Pholiota conissans]|uniref:Nephrocystin 3-like N-terminal domain-containing protein n=1 Tax=Pholiota conissans TaxID=109636 RepID=A0A9P6CX13_9AGAR|nr:hypothetical protein BDN70DRAFT_209706 [Pholiota conissans]
MDVVQIGFGHMEVPRQMFGDNTAIFDGHFTQAGSIFQIQSSYDGRAEAFKRLPENVCPAAFHNSAQRIDPPRCHPGTRIKILQDIFDWVLIYAQDRKAWILWLNGAAGAGKSAIMQSIAERLLSVKSIINTGSFFFFRGDPMRNTTASLVATLAYQLICAFPEISDNILHTVEHDPFIFNRSIEAQLEVLIIQPIICLPFYLQRLFVVIIDGVDECLDRSQQADLIKTLGKISSRRDVPVIFLVASRREAQIMSELCIPEVDNILQQIALDDICASDDIRLFLNESFSKIKNTHLHRYLLPEEWPLPAMVEEIVAKSSNQMVYASVVIRYISSPRANPVHQLKIIRNLRLRDPSAEHPLAPLDALYQYIFSQVQCLNKVLDILAYSLTTGGYMVTRIENQFNLEPGELKMLLIDLAAVIRCDLPTKRSAKITFLHASLTDFLLDETRSGKYFIDREIYTEKLLCMALETTLGASQTDCEKESSRLTSITVSLQRVKPSDRLRRAIIDSKYPFHVCRMDNYSMNTSSRIMMLRILKKMNFNDQGDAYRHVVNVFAEGYAKFWSSYDTHIQCKVRKYRDLRVRICQLRPELSEHLSSSRQTKKQPRSVGP